MVAQRILDKLRELGNSLNKPLEDTERRLLIDQMCLVIERCYGKGHKFVNKANDIRDGTYRDGKSQRTASMNLIKLVATDLELDDEAGTVRVSSNQLKEMPSNVVFIVHGRDEEMKQAVARCVEALGLQAIVLHERPDKGRTIIEKFHEFSEVRFAVALLSPDDVGRIRGSPVDRDRPRPRQNVLFELGFFLGKLGRSKVLALVRPTGDFELLSDYSGVLLKQFDASGNWRFELCRELKEAGYPVDANRLLA